MIHHHGPRRGSRPYLALKQLHSLGGRSGQAQWMSAAKWSDSACRFSDDVINTLITSSLVFQRGAEYLISDTGLDFLGVAVDAVPAARAAVVGPAYHPTPKALNTRKHCPAPDPRPDAFDYRNIPSLIGNRHVAYEPKA